MIKIIDVDYTDMCSCCDDKVKIVKNNRLDTFINRFLRKLLE